MMRPKKKTIEEIYAPKLIVNHQKSQVQAVNKNREREPVKIEHKCEKTGLMVTLSSPPAPIEKKPYAPRPGNLTYRINPNNSQNKNNNTSISNYNMSHLNKSMNTLNSVNRSRLTTQNISHINNGRMNNVKNRTIFVNNNSLNKLDNNRVRNFMEQTNQEEEVFDLEKIKKCRPKSKTSRVVRRKVNIEKLFQYIPTEAGNEDMPMEPPVELQRQQHFKGPIHQGNVAPKQSAIVDMRPKNSPVSVIASSPLDSYEMDQETAEFVGYIRAAVEAGVEKAVTAPLQENYKLITSQIENLAAEVKKMQLMIRKVQEDLNEKIVHYGEETSRHFRYLCMKSEYDKLFYQHNLTVTLANVNSVPSMVDDKQKTVPTHGANCSSSMNVPQQTENKLSEPVPIQQNDVKKTEDKPLPTSSQSKAQKSSEEQVKVATMEPKKEDQPRRQSFAPTENDFKNIESFCKRMKDHDNGLELFRKPPTGTLYNSEEIMIINKEVYDDDESFMSSEAMTPTSTGNMAKYENQAIMASKSIALSSAGGSGDA